MAPTLWNATWPIAASAIYVLGVHVFKYNTLPEWCKVEVLPDWHIEERRIQRGVNVPKEAGLPRGWVKERTLLGRAVYHDLITDEQSFERPQARPLYTTIYDLQKYAAGSGLVPRVRLLVVVPAKNFNDQLEGVIFLAPTSRHGVVTEQLDLQKQTLWYRAWHDMAKRFPLARHLMKKPLNVWRSAWGNILSYCWGDPSITETMIVNDKPVPITVNLAAALRQLRHNYGKEPIFLWVDSLCINQEDSIDVVIQFRLMSAYYGLAHTVHAWLGIMEDTASRDRFLDVRSTYNNELDWHDSNLATEKILDRSYSPEEVKADIQCLKAVAMLPYWKRKWIIQECILARRLRVHIGDRNMLFKQSSAIAQRLSLLEKDLQAQLWYVKSVPGYEDYVKVFDDLPRERRVGLYAGLMAGARLKELSQGKTADRAKLMTEMPLLISMLRQSLATRSADAVLGLVALLQLAFQIDVDPFSDFKDLFYSVTVSLLRASQSLFLLGQSRYCGPGEDGYPSYMIDFRPPTGYTPHFDGNPFARQASGGAQANFSILQCKLLQTGAFDLGTIKAIRQAADDDDAEPSNRYPLHSHAWTRRQYAEWKEFFDEHDDDPEHEFQWTFLMQGIHVVCYDCEEDRLATDEDVAYIKERLPRYLAGDDTAEHAHAKHFLDNLTIFVTDRGQFGMCHARTLLEVGHRIVALAGAPFPFTVSDNTSNMPLCDHCQAALEDKKLYHVCRYCNEGTWCTCGNCSAKGLRCQDAAHPTLDQFLLYDHKPHRLTGSPITDHGTFDPEAPLVHLTGSCYLHEEMYGESIQKAAADRFGHAIEVDKVFDRIAIY